MSIKCEMKVWRELSIKSCCIFNVFLDSLKKKGIIDLC